MPKVCNVCGKVEGQVHGSKFTVGALKDPHAIEFSYRIRIAAFDIEWAAEDFHACSTECLIAYLAEVVTDLRRELEEHRSEESQKLYEERVAAARGAEETA